MRIGYACLTMGVPETNLKKCILKNANESNLISLIEHNLQSLENIIDYNIKNHIRLFRISSDLIPFGSSPINEVPWWDVFSSRLSSIEKKIKKEGIRISMHPGQYTVLNSPNEDVVKRAIEDLNYHNKVLESLGAGIDSKIILHIGGVYEDKEKAINRFIKNFQLLDEKIKKRLVIENDDKLFNIDDVLRMGKILNIPVVFDNLHNEVLPFDSSKDDKYWINKCRETWKEEDGVQKIHYSQQNSDKRLGAHSNTIEVETFMDFIKNLDKEIDIMLEVKDKNLSAVKCINSISPDKKISALELEWSKYKYNVLECSPTNYNKVRELLKNKNNYPVVEFYKLLDDALEKKEIVGNSINAALHVWGYFKSIASEDEKKKFKKSLERYEEGNISINSMKKLLWKMALKYNETYLLDSYYFYF